VFLFTFLHLFRFSSPAPPNTSETDGTSGGRERRTRKSVNYAEPKTQHVRFPSSFFHNVKIFRKMRKPDPSDPLRLISAAAVLSTTVYKSVMGMGNEADADTEARSSLEVPPAPLPSLSGFLPASAVPSVLRGVLNAELFFTPSFPWVCCGDVLAWATNADD
jgi:hypothetical protein